MQLIKLLILKLKMMIICRECDIEIDASIGYPEHELMNHFNNLYERCMKCMQKKYNGYHFLDKRKVNSTGHITSVPSYIDYTDINNIDSDDNIDISEDKDKDDVNKVFCELKDNIIENFKDYIKSELKTELINEIKNDIKKILSENKDIIIDEVIKYKLYAICKITANSFYQNTLICMKCKDIETKLCPICKTNKSYTEFYNKGNTCVSCLK